MRRRRRAGPIVVLIVIGLVLFVVIGLVVEAARTPDGPKDYRPPAAIPPPGSVTGIDQNGKPLPGPLGPLKLVAGARLAAGVSVGFPHSTVGAISAAAQYWGQIASTLDPARVKQIAGVVADPTWKNAARDLSVGPIRTRKGLGLPTSGPVPAGASVMLTPVEYQVRQVAADSVTVLLLGYYQTSVPGKETENRVGVFPAQMHWATGDWKIPSPTLGSDYSDLEVQPGSPEAKATGWQPLSSD